LFLRTNIQIVASRRMPNQIKLFFAFISFFIR
jgi:hypothetical protein